jgi:hypothetical protein
LSHFTEPQKAPSVTWTTMQSIDVGDRCAFVKFPSPFSQTTGGRRTGAAPACAAAPSATRAPTSSSRNVRNVPMTRPERTRFVTHIAPNRTPRSRDAACPTGLSFRSAPAGETSAATDYEEVRMYIGGGVLTLIIIILILIWLL